MSAEVSRDLCRRRVLRPATSSGAMKRDPRLHGLSSEHHQGLVLARRLAQGRLDAGELRRRFDAELEPHFRVEEDVLLPALETSGEAALVARTRRDHAELRALVEKAGGGDAAALARFAALLNEHIRFEERELFPAAEARVPGAILDRVQALAPHEPARPDPREA